VGTATSIPAYPGRVKMVMPVIARTRLQGVLYACLVAISAANAVDDLDLTLPPPQGGPQDRPVEKLFRDGRRHTLVGFLADCRRTENLQDVWLRSIPEPVGAGLTARGRAGHTNLALPAAKLRYRPRTLACRGCPTCG
jgi:hypothetical protein